MSSDAPSTRSSYRGFVCHGYCAAVVKNVEVIDGLRLALKWKPRRRVTQLEPDKLQGLAPHTKPQATSGSLLDGDVCFGSLICRTSQGTSDVQLLEVVLRSFWDRRSY